MPCGRWPAGGSPLHRHANGALPRPADRIPYHANPWTTPTPSTALQRPADDAPHQHPLNGTPLSRRTHQAFPRPVNGTPLSCLIDGNLLCPSQRAANCTILPRSNDSTLLQRPADCIRLKAVAGFPHARAAAVRGPPCCMLRMLRRPHTYPFSIASPLPGFT